MTENPIAGILGLMQSEGAKNNPPGICLGKIISISPLKVKTDDLVLDKEDLLVSHLLLDSYTREIQKVTNSSNQIINPEMSNIEFKICLEAGDLVALMPTVDYETYILLCKVV